MRRYGEIKFTDKIATLDDPGIVRFVGEMPPLELTPEGTVVVLAKTQYGFQAGGLYVLKVINDEKTWVLSGQLAK